MLGVDPCHSNNGSWERVSEFLADELEERIYQPQSFSKRVSPPFALFLVVMEVIVCRILIFINMYP